MKKISAFTFIIFMFLAVIGTQNDQMIRGYKIQFQDLQDVLG